MIVVPEGSAYRLITQPDHAHLAAEILALWRRDGLPAHPRRDDLLFAAREHDNGWREADAAPRWDARAGRPHDFMTLPQADRIEIWERGTCRFATERPYAALLITRHARNLFGGRRGEEGWDGLLDFLADFERGLSEETGAPEDELAADYRWIDLADQISLTACARRREPVDAPWRPDRAASGPPTGTASPPSGSPPSRSPERPPSASPAAASRRGTTAATRISAASSPRRAGRSWRCGSAGRTAASPASRRRPAGRRRGAPSARRPGGRGGGGR